ncbi:GNAT family N-acetyltransferase [Aquimarina sp. M1]
MRSSEFAIERSFEKISPQAIAFLEKVFYEEQGIPKELIPLYSYNHIWWCIKTDNAIVGIAAAWEITSEWHWGRLAIDKKVRGFGVGKEITKKSLTELFQMSIEKVKIDARDITVKMISKIGGKIIGETTDFYGTAITPMIIQKKDFVL